MDTFPNLTWDAEPGALYTVIVEDEDPGPFPGSTITHFLAVNIPGKFVLTLRIW